MVRLVRLLQTDPAPVTTTLLLVAVEPAPTAPVASKTAPPLLMISWLKLLPGLPTVSPAALLQTEPPPAINTVLLRAAPLPPISPVALKTWPPLVSSIWQPGTFSPTDRLEESTAGLP